MWDWYNRYQQRQADLARGVDADLVRANAKRAKLGWVLLGVGALLSLLGSKLHLSGITGTILNYVAGGIFLAGFVVAKFAGMESREINKPTPKPPLTLFPKQ